jgi:hypothetical protein
MALQLQHLILTFKPEGVEIRTLYRTKGGPRPNTKAHTKEVTELARAGLTQALKALEERVDCVGTSGYDVREDVLVAEMSSYSERSAA